MDANAAASSHVSATIRKPSRTPSLPARLAVRRSSAYPAPLVTVPATREGCTGSATPRYFPSVPTRFNEAGTSIASRRGRPMRATDSVNSQRLDDPRHVRGLGEDDHPVAGLEDVVAVGEDRVAVAHDRS